MSAEINIIILLSSLLILMFVQIWSSTRQQQNTDKHKALNQALQNYPVHKYTMAHMLERSLAIIFSTPNLSLLPTGCFLLHKNDTLQLIAHRGLDFDYLNSYQTTKSQQYLNSKLLQDLKEYPLIHPSELQNSPLYNKAYSHTTQAILPLSIQDRRIGLLILYLPNKYSINNYKINLLKNIANTISKLIDSKIISDELRLGNSVMELSQQAILITDKNNRIIRCNKACENMMGYSAFELINQSPSIFKSNKHKPYFYQQLWHSLKQTNTWQGEIWNIHKDGYIFPEWLTISCIRDSNNETIQYLAIFTDLSSTKKAEKDIHQLTFFDPITELANRNSFNKKINQLINTPNTLFTMMYLDIDHFQKINDSLGHIEGDKLLRIFADRISKIAPNSSHVARTGGDEFALIIEQNSYSQDKEDISKLAMELLQALKQPIKIASHDFMATVSIGISHYPKDADNTTDLIKYADTALFHAKQTGRNNYQYYNSLLNSNSLEKIRLESAIRLALKEGHFEIHLQPQLDLNSQNLIGAEALLRAHTGELANISPADYIPIAEETGLIVDIGDWVFQHVCELLQHWHHQDSIPHGFKRIAINISPVQFKRPDFIKKIQNILKETSTPVHYLEIELTESALQESDYSVTDKLITLKAMGLNIAIDDFGTGYSSLSRLKQFPIDLLKIDRSFVLDICNNHSDMAIIKAIIHMAKALNIQTLTEGIEYSEQSDLLKILQCDYGQGFLFDKALNIRQFKALMHTKKKSRGQPA